MRILDLGCGKATSSIFLAREFGVEVWAVDGATSPSENRKRAIARGCEASVFPLRVDAHSLPFAKDFFDAVIAIDSFLYYGTDDRYLSYLVQFIKPGGFIGVVDIAFSAMFGLSRTHRNISVPNTRSTGPTCTPSSGGRIIGRKPDWSRCVAPSFYPRATICCAIMRGTGRRSRMKIRSCGPCRKITTDWSHSSVW
jgi:ubiquinone/menaquinone biosynthesis C-methylase UbiE